jgi:HEAT repeat protein
VQNLETLEKGLHHDDAEVRWVAVLLLEEMRTPEAIDLLITALDDPYLSVRWRAAVALGNIGQSRAADPLIRALEDPNQHVRKEAAVSLGKIGDQKSIDPLIRHLTDADRGVRIAAARALVNIGAPARPALVKASRSTDERLRAAAGDALQDLEMRMQRKETQALSGGPAGPGSGS